MLVTAAAFAYSPGQIKRAAGPENGKETVHSRWDIRGIEMHDDGFAQHIDEACVGDAGKLRQARPAERDARMQLPRLREKTFGRVVADGGEAILRQPRGVAPATAADVRGRTGCKILFHRCLKIGRRRLFVPVGRKSCGVPIIGGKCLLIHVLMLSLQRADYRFVAFSATGTAAFFQVPKPPSIWSSRLPISSVPAQKDGPRPRIER